MKKLVYKNPIILSDYSDPDVIRAGKDFFMVSSSFNYVPGIPVLHSENLVEWEIVNYVLPSLPFVGYDRVRHGEGAWAPSIRYYGGRFYCLIPFPDEGIFVSETSDIYGEWSPLRPLLKGRGYEDPCPLWYGDKCYVAFAFVKSRIGFNSKIAVFETDCALTKPAQEYKIVYDGTGVNPTIEGPKLYRRGKYFYILAPAGGVKNGWQVALRSENIYGKYESEIILSQAGTDVNGPHQGALVDFGESDNEWAFIHFQQKGALGRVIHLQPAVWKDFHIVCGDNGAPVKGGEYPVQIKTDYNIEPCDRFDGDKLSLIWQFPANPPENAYSLADGLKLACLYYEKGSLGELPQLLTQKIRYENFDVDCEFEVFFKSDGDEAGLTVFGESYSYICVVREGNSDFIELRYGCFGNERDKVAYRIPFIGNKVTLKIFARLNNEGIKINYGFGEEKFSCFFYAVPEKWVGSRLGVYARSLTETAGYCVVKQFSVKKAD